MNGVAWNPARFSSIGPVPGYQPPALTLNASLAQSVGWRGKHSEAIGTFHWGARPYEPASGRFLAHDPAFDAANPEGFSVCGGDMVNNFDADGRFAKGFSEGLESYGNKLENSVLGTLADVGIISPLTASRYSQETHEPGYYVYPSAAYEAGVNAGYSAVPTAVILASMLMMPELGAGEAGVARAEIGMVERSAFGAEARVFLGEEEALAAEANVVKTDFQAAQSEANLLASGVGSQSYVPYRQGVNYNRQTFNESFGTPLAAEETAGLRQLGGIRNTQPLSPAQIQQVYQHVDELGLSRSDFLIHSGPSLYSDMMDKVLIGPDVFPGLASDASVLSQLSPRAVIAHEAGHMINTVGGMAFEAGSVMDEAAASMMGRQLPGLTTAERNLLLQHARGRGH